MSTEKASFGSIDLTGRYVVAITGGAEVHVHDAPRHQWLEPFKTPAIAQWEVARWRAASRRLVAIGSDQRQGNLSTLVVFDAPPASPP